jgi:hypothetical protein
MEPDADTYPIHGEQRPGEPGTFTFARDLALYVEGELSSPVTDLVHRENPWSRRPCRKAWTYEFQVAAHRVVVTSFEATHPLHRGSFTRFAIAVDGHQTLFDPDTFTHPVSWQLARAIHAAIPAHDPANLQRADQPVPALRNLASPTRVTSGVTS